ncbi:MAG TPA: UDP-N-acetylmuramoyl-tripeptide--D-alanyl-D-alanine ligase [Gaiellaceae bacterium]|nr:UDP-N-acetylmuramoyl-tripeptide--D-alanyl-D-alanine ligase [Gaiellaceae bacterium]
MRALSLGRLVAGSAAGRAGGARQVDPAFGGGSDAETVTGVEVDSRRIAPGDLFVAVSGGEAFLADARSRGAAATLVPDDAFAALAALGSAVRARSDARVVAITGSVGKTSTKDILAALLRGRLRTVAAPDGYNNEVGLPLTLCRIEPDTEVVVTEMAMRGPGQIRDLARVALPQLGVITSIAPVHLEQLGSLENIARAKAELLDELPAGAVAVLPQDAPELEPFVPEGLDVRRFASPEAEVRDGQTYVHWQGGDVVFSFAARHQAANAAAALTAAEALGVEPPREPVEVAFSRLRSQETELPGGGLLINDAWNANPVAMRAALAHLRDRANGRRTVAILGEMAELGAEAPRYHAEIGRAAEGIDLVLGVGELARGYEPDEWAPTAADAVQTALALVRPGDAILVKGSRSVGLEVVAEALAEAGA